MKMVRFENYCDWWFPFHRTMILFGECSYYNNHKWIGEPLWLEARRLKEKTEYNLCCRRKSTNSAPSRMKSKMMMLIDLKSITSGFLPDWVTYWTYSSLLGPRYRVRTLNKAMFRSLESDSDIAGLDRIWKIYRRYPILSKLLGFRGVLEASMRCSGMVPTNQRSIND